MAIAVHSDMAPMQQCHYSNKRYFAWLQNSDEPSSVKRIALIVILIATLSTFARMSWYVMAVLAVAILSIGIAMARKKPETPEVISKRTWKLFFTEYVLMLVVMVVAALFGEVLEERILCALYVALAFTAFSYAFTMAANWLTRPFFGKDDANNKENLNEKE